MTVPSTTSAIAYTADGTTATFPYTWAIAASADLVVYRVLAGATSPTLLALGTDYTVAGAGIATGGTVVLTAGNPVAGTRVFIASDPSEVQTLLLEQGIAMNPASVMAQIDQLTRMVQSVRRLVNGALQIPVAESQDGYGTTLPLKPGRASGFVYFDPAGNVGIATGAASAPVSPAMAPVVASATTAAARAAMGPWSDALVTTAGAPTARDLQTRFGDVVNVKDYAAKGDGVTDDRTAILNAEAVAFAAGMPLYFPAAVYAVNNTPGRLGLRVTVLGYGATVKLTAVSDAYATVSNYTVAGTKQTDIAFYGLTVNANALARGFYIEGGDRCKLIDCKVTNAKEAGIGVYNATDAEVAGCNVAGVGYLVNGQSGLPADGIYFGGCVRNTARANRVTDIQRIGIVSESNSGVRSSGVRIVDNIIFNAHDCDNSTSEYNAGIWVEGSNGSTIARNRISAIGGNAGQTSGRVYGMLVCGLGENASEAFIVCENHVSVWTGSLAPKNIAIVATATAADANVIVASNYVADCAQAVHLGVGMAHVTLRDLDVDNVKWTGGNDALILVDNSATTLTSLTIDNVRLTNLNDADATNDAAHIVIYNGAAITRVAISHVYGFNLQQRSSTSVVGRLDISDAEIAYGSATSYGCLRAAEVYCTNVKFTRYASRGVLHFIDTTVNAMQVKFANCKWDGAGGTGWSLNGANNLDCEFVGCSFYNGVELAPALTAALQNFRFHGCLMDEFSTSGFFNSGGSTTTGMRVFFRGCDFKRSTNVTPIQKNSAQPAKSVFAYNTIAGSIVALHDYTAPTQDVGTVTA